MHIQFWFFNDEDHRPAISSSSYPQRGHLRLCENLEKGHDQGALEPMTLMGNFSVDAEIAVSHYERSVGPQPPCSGTPGFAYEFPTLPH